MRKKVSVALTESVRHGGFMRIISRRSVLLTTAAVGSLLAAAAPATVASAAGSQPHAPASPPWTISLKVTGSDFPSFEAVTATSATNAWAFDSAGSGAPHAYHLSGSTWTKEPFPGVSGDQVLSASSTSASNVWAFTFQGRVVQFKSGIWSNVKKFSKAINSGLAINSTDVWVFGEGFAPELGTWHFNGTSWAKSSSGSGLQGASALSASSIWAYGGTNVAHYNGSTWKKTSVKSLLPKNTELSHSFVAGIDAISARNVYAVASGGRQDEGGPVVMLHYNGSHWSKIASKQTGGPVAIVPDGSGGFWIPVTGGESSRMLHFTHGALNFVTLPYSPAHLLLFGAANGPHSKVAFAVGFNRKSFSATTSTAVILRVGS
jgi:hypothetical protein